MKAALRYAKNPGDPQALGRLAGLLGTGGAAAPERRTTTQVHNPTDESEATPHKGEALASWPRTALSRCAAGGQHQVADLPQQAVGWDPSTAVRTSAQPVSSVTESPEPQPPPPPQVMGKGRTPGWTGSRTTWPLPESRGQMVPSRNSTSPRHPLGVGPTNVVGGGRRTSPHG